MTEAIWVAIITSICSLIGVILTVWLGNKKQAKTAKEQADLTIYRIDQLEKKVSKHNNLVDRMYKLEDRVHILEHSVSEHSVINVVSEA